MSATEVERSRPAIVVGWDVADRLFGTNDADRADHSGRRRSFPDRRRQQEARFVSRPVAGCVIIMPLGQFQKIFGSRRQLNLTVKPKDLSQIELAMDDATVALRIARRFSSRGKQNNFGLFTSETFLALYRSATNGDLCSLVGVVALSLVVGGIVIMNIMLMAVSNGPARSDSERRSARDVFDIMMQMLTESVVPLRDRARPRRCRVWVSSVNRCSAPESTLSSLASVEAIADTRDSKNPRRSARRRLIRIEAPPTPVSICIMMSTRRRRAPF